MIRPHPKPPKHKRKKPDGRLSMAELKRLRDAAFYRDGYACINPDCPCKKDPTLPPISYVLAIHHRIKLSQGGKDVLENVVTLCAVCHDAVHRDNLKEQFIDDYLGP